MTLVLWMSPGLHGISRLLTDKDNLVHYQDIPEYLQLAASTLTYSVVCTLPSFKDSGFMDITRFLGCLKFVIGCLPRKIIWYITRIHQNTSNLPHWLSHTLQSVHSLLSRTLVSWTSPGFQAVQNLQWVAYQGRQFDMLPGYTRIPPTCCINSYALCSLHTISFQIIL